MADELNEITQLSVDDLLLELYACHLKQEAKMTAMLATMTSFTKLHLGSDAADKLLKNFDAIVKEEIERLKTDNTIYNKVISDRFLNSLRDNGIDLSK